MHIREGIVPAVLGTVITATGIIFKNNIPDSYRTRIIGFGLANIAIGSVELAGQSIKNKDIKKNVLKAIPLR